MGYSGRNMKSRLQNALAIAIICAISIASAPTARAAETTSMETTTAYSTGPIPLHDQTYGEIRVSLRDFHNGKPPECSVQLSIKRKANGTDWPELLPTQQTCSSFRDLILLLRQSGPWALEKSGVTPLTK